MQKRGKGKKIGNKKGNKRGLSTIIVTLIIILISLVAVGIIWIVVRNVIQAGTEGVSFGQFMLNAKIMDANIDNSTNNISLIVKRNAGQGELVGMKFVFSDGKNSEVITEEFSMNELEQRGFTFHLTNLNVSNLESISISPILKQEEKQVTGGILDQYMINKGKKPRTCTPSTNCSALGYVCGTWGNGTCLGTLNCGTCSGGLTCNATGGCQAGCTPSNCSSRGYECGIGYGDGCSGTFNCEPPTCTTRYGAGYTCNASGRCVTSGGGALCEPNTYYIDFLSGNDNNNGTCNNSAWKHTPGDLNATGTARLTNLTPGKTVRFRDGVIYNGMLGVKWSGTPGNSITYTSYPGGRAIMDGTNFNNTLFDWTRAPGGKAHWVVLRNLEIRNYFNYGISIHGDHNIVENCNVHTGLSLGGNEPMLIAEGDYNQIIYSEFHDSNWNCVNVQNANYTNVSYNNIYDCPDHGGLNFISNTVTYFGMMTGNDIHHNYLHDIGPQGALYLRYQRNNKIYNNIFDLGPESAAHMNLYFAYGDGGPTNYTANTEIYNNIIIGGRWSIFNDAASNITIKNNIFKDPANGVFMDISSATTGHVIDYNLYNGTGVWRIGGAQYSTLASLPSPYEDNGLMGNPGFVNEAGNDFRYTASSAAINRGTDLSSRGVRDDYAGTSRPQGAAFDIGAYEYV